MKTGLDRRIDGQGELESGTGRRVPLEVPLPVELPEPVRIVVTRCVPAQMILVKGRAGTPLTQTERHVLVHLFTHLGEEGRRFIHQVLAQTDGYDPDAAEREIHGVPPQVIGCRRIRRILKLDSIRDCCDCVFRLPEGSYATPLVHADLFPRPTKPSLRGRMDPVDLDGEGRVAGYVCRRAKAAARLDEIDRRDDDNDMKTLARSLLSRLFGRS